MPKPLILLAHGEVPPEAPPDEQDVLEEVHAVSQALHVLGYATASCPVTLDLAALRMRLLQQRPHAIFNLVESLAGRGAYIALPALVYEDLALPFTGAPSRAMWLSSNKLLSKRLLKTHGLPTAPWTVQGKGLEHDLFIIKSVWEHASVGLDDHSVVRAECVEESLAQRRAAGGEWFAERFIEGREFNVGLLQCEHGAQTLPVTEISFTQFPAGKPRIVGYAAKWNADTFEYQNTQRQFLDTALESRLSALLGRLALHCWDLFELRGYARVDFRLDAQDQPWILEVNANPCLSPDAGFAAMLHRAGIEYSKAIACIVAAAGTA